MVSSSSWSTELVERLQGVDEERAQTPVTENRDQTPARTQ
jgi:hypothetical protein